MTGRDSADRAAVTPERWRLVNVVLQAALAAPAETRAQLLDRACGSDVELRREVESLLGSAAEVTDGFLAPRTTIVDLSSRGDTSGQTEGRSDHSEAVAHQISGAVAGRYLIDREIGKGGMASVFLARDTQLDRPVAVKVIRRDLVATVGTARFLREIRLTARLQHPNIVPVLDAGDAAGLPYFVMPYVDGESLRDRLRREQCLTLSGTFEVFRQIASALIYAHGLGVVHRDVKPENILLDRAGNAMVADFGIARAIGEAAGETVTMTGLVLGTPTYMSPEQAVGERQLDHRSDIYSLACVVYEMLTGEPPYTAEAVFALIGKHHAAPIPSARHLRADVPPQLDAALQRALAKDPADRFVSIADMLDACRTSIATSPAPVAGETPTVAVVDFMNETGDSSLEWLGLGVAETVTQGLKALGGVHAVGRDRVNRVVNLRPHAAGAVEDVIAIGRLLGAAWVVWGRYVSLGNDRLRIVPLLGRTDATELQSLDPIDSPLADIVAAQGRVVTSIAGMVDGGASHRLPTPTPETNAVTAYEAFARGRQLFRRFGPASFNDAQAQFERAIAADPGYAQAYSGLGSIYAFRYIATGSPTDLEIAVSNLERARALDPELGEAYIWLAYAYMRQHRFEESERCLAKARELEPDNPFTYYFASARGTLYRVPGLSWHERIPPAVANYLRAIEVEPSFQVAYMNLATFYMAAGQYAPARPLLDRALQIEQTVKSRDVRFVGALAMRGLLHLREGQISQARALLEQALDVYPAADHVYAPAFTVTTRNALGEIAFHERDPDAAVGHFSAACELCDTHRRRVGMGLLLARAQIGLAKAFRALGMRRDEQRQIARVDALLRQEGEYNFEWVWGASQAQVHYDLASYYAMTGRVADALGQLDIAIELDWGDLPFLARDETFTRLRRDGGLESRMERVRARGALPEPDAAFWSGTEHL